MRTSLTDFPGAAAHYLRSREQFGDPGFSYSAAVNDIEGVHDLPPVEQQRTTDLSEETEERLHDLGYL